MEYQKSKFFILEVSDSLIRSWDLIIPLFVVVLSIIGCESSSSLEMLEEPETFQSPGETAQTYTNSSEKYPGPAPRFRYYSLDEGLSQSTVTEIIQDQAGYIWIGTEDGLNKFNGYEFEIFRHNPDDPNSISDNLVTAVAVDESGKIWAGTYRGGLNSFDSTTRSFERFIPGLLESGASEDSEILVIAPDPNGSLWLGTGSGLINFDPETETKIPFQYGAIDSEALEADSVLSLLIDSSNTLWAGTFNGLFKLDPDRVVRKHFLNDPDNPASLGGNAIESIYEDLNGILWVGTSDGGLDRFNPDSEEFSHYQSTMDGSQNLRSNRIVSIAEDPWGILWVGTDAGLHWLNPETNSFKVFVEDNTLTSSLSSNLISDIFIDRSGGVWIGTDYSGLNYYDRQAEKFHLLQADPDNPNSLIDNSIWSILENSSGDLWIGTNGDGLYHLDRSKKQWEQFQHDPINEDSLSHNVVMAIDQDAENILWLGTWGGGLNRLDPDRLEFSSFRHDGSNPDSISSDTVWFIEEDLDGTFWVGTDNGLNHFYPREGVFERYFHDPDDSSSLSSDLIGGILVDSTGNLWVGTHSGLNLFNRQSGQFTRYLHNIDDPNGLSHDIIFSIFEDSTGNLWLGTYGGGINLFDPQNGAVTAYRQIDGLANDSVYGILEDDAGFLWISTNNGLSKFDPITETFHNYDEGDGLQAREFNYNAYYKNDRGTLYFGGVNGLNYFTPGDIHKNSYIPPIVVTSIAQAGIPIATDSEGIYPGEIVLRWPNNFFEFEFAALSYFQPEENQYAYKLEPFEEEWNVINGRTGRYTNLPGGTYTLRLIGANNDGYWNETGYSVPIRIIPPFWDTWLFRGVLVFAVIAALLIGYQLRLRNLKSRGRELELQVRNRTQELEAINRIAATVSESLDLPATMDDALEKTLEVLGVDGAGIFLLDQGTGRLSIAAECCLDPEIVEEVKKLIVDEHLPGQVSDPGQPFILKNVSIDPDLKAVKSEIRSLGIVPLTSKGRFLGNLFVITRGERALDTQDLTVFSSIGHQIGVAIENARLFEDTKNRLAQVAALQNTNQALVSTLDLDILLNRIVEQASTLLNARGGILNLIDWDSHEDYVVAAYGSTSKAIGYRTPLDASLSGWASLNNQSTISNDPHRDDRVYHKGILELGMEPLSSAAVAPLAIVDKVIGTLIVVDKYGSELGFVNEDLELLTAFANQAATAINNARLYEAEQRRAEQFQVISDISQRLTALLEEGEVLQQVVNVIYQAFGYDHVGIGLVEEDEVVYRVGAGKLAGNPGFQFKPDRLKIGGPGIASWVIVNNSPLLVPDVSQDRRYVHMDGSQTQSELVVPITLQNVVIGILDVQSNQLNAFDQTDVVVLQSFAHLAGTAIENARLFEQAQQLGVLEERQRLARELHDSVTQALYGITLYAEAMARHLAAGRVTKTADQLTDLQQTAQEALREMRLLIFQLRPPDLEKEGLATVLRTRLEAVESRAGVSVEFTADETLRLPLDQETGLYRIAQEALNNILKHASASHICVHFEINTEVSILQITDDGVGFHFQSALESSGVGLDGMLERADQLGGEIVVDSTPGRGTSLKIIVPR